MTHDEMTELLRGDDSFVLSQEDDAEIADRLDRYRDIIRRCERLLPFDSRSAPDDVRDLLRDIREALK